MTPAQLDALLDRLRATDRAVDAPLYAPAPPVAIDRWERRLELSLPNDYRAFLEESDGWHEPRGGLFILTLDEVLSGDFNDPLEEIEEQARALGYHPVALVAHITDEDTGWALLRRGATGAFVEFHQGVIGELVSFGALLQSYLETFVWEEG